jgi:hypothetical protein
VDPTETDPLVADTDLDGYDDGTERALGSDPLDSASVPSPLAVPGLGGIAVGLLALSLCVSGLRRGRSRRRS